MPQNEAILTVYVRNGTINLQVGIGSLMVKAVYDLQSRQLEANLEITPEGADNAEDTPS